MVCQYLSKGRDLVYGLVPQLKDCSNFDTSIIELISKVSQNPCNAVTIIEQSAQNCTDATCFMLQEVID